MRKKLKLERKMGNLWTLSHGKILLVEFSVLDQVEAVRFAENWLSSFPSLYIELEVPDECSIPNDPQKIRVSKTDNKDNTA